MEDVIKIPYENGVEEAVAVPLPEGYVPTTSNVQLSDGNELRLELHVKNIFRLLHKKDEKGEPVYIFSLQVKSETMAKPVGAIETEAHN